MGFSRMLQDAVECHRMQQNLVEYRVCSLSQMLLWALQATGRDGMSPLQRQLPPPLCESPMCR